MSLMPLLLQDREAWECLLCSVRYLASSLGHCGVPSCSGPRSWPQGPSQRLPLPAAAQTPECPTFLDLSWGHHPSGQGFHRVGSGYAVGVREPRCAGQPWGGL